jgi:hypothetical protein
LYLNSKQKVIYILGIILIIGMCIFPPWIYTYKSNGTYSENPAGYSFIAEPPSPRSYNIRNGVEIDLNRLFIQIIAGASFIGLGLLIFSRKTDNK